MVVAINCKQEHCWKHIECRSVPRVLAVDVFYACGYIRGLSIKKGRQNGRKLMRKKAKIY